MAWYPCHGKWNHREAALLWVQVALPRKTAELSNERESETRRTGIGEHWTGHGPSKHPQTTMPRPKLLRSTIDNHTVDG